MKPAALTAALFLAFVAIVHAARFILQIPITAGSVEFPLAASAVGAVLIGGLAVWLWREQSR